MTQPQEVTRPGTTNALYTYAPQLYGNLISQRRGSTSHWHLFDALGSTLGLTDSAMAVTDEYFYEAYGQIAASTGTTVNPFKWVGQVGYYTESPLANLPYVRARYYNKQLARWMSRDPVRYEGTSNLFEYSNSRPVFLVDPSGKFPDYWCWAGLDWNLGGKCCVQCGDVRSEGAQSQQIGASEAYKCFPDWRDVRNRALRHCIASGMLATLTGCTCAACLGWHREGFQNECGGQNPREGDRGRYNNAQGRLCAGCVQLTGVVPIAGFGGPKDKKTREQIVECCKKKLADGKLDVGDGPSPLPD